MCTFNDPDPQFPDTGEICCEGAAIYGPQRCTCWRPVYDLDQTRPDPATAGLLAAGIEPNTRRRMCGDCAYRPGSPERNGDPRFRGDAEFLEQLAAGADDANLRFWCHQGMRKIIAWRHPSGMEIPDDAGAAYDPPIHVRTPWCADGTPGELCAGWDARRRALTAAGR